MSTAVPSHAAAGDSTVRSAPPAAWGGVFALSLGSFALVAAEFMPVSLLTAIAADLRVTEGQAGQAITVSGVFALLTSLAVTRVAGRLDRKLLLLALTALMIAAGTIAAFAPNYAVYMTGRALIGVAIGGFWSLCAATAMRLVPSDQVPKALAVINAGSALATVIAAPLGSTLGALVGWRGAFFCLIPVTVVALGWKWLSLPAMPAATERGRHSMFTLLQRRPVALGMAACSLFFMGQFALFTYLRPFLETVTHASAATTSLLLLTMGVCGFAGTTVIGRPIRQRMFLTLAGIPAIMAIVAVLLMGFGASTWTTAVLLAVWGLLGTSAPVGWWTWLARTLPDDAEAGGGLIVAVVQLAIASGAALGGLLFDGFGYQATFGFAAVILIVAAVLAMAAGRSAQAA